MKALLVIPILAFATSASAACITTAMGRTVCRDASGQIVAEPPGAAAVAVPGAAVAVPGAAVVAPHPYGVPETAAVVPHATTEAYGAYGGRAVEGAYGNKAVQGAYGNTAAYNPHTGSAAAYNPHTGNAAVSGVNANGVRTTETSRGGEAKTADGMGVAHGAGGTTCAKGRGEAHCN
jgi:hypothetical protein